MPSTIDITVYKPGEKMPRSWQLVLAWEPGEDRPTFAQWSQESLIWWRATTAEQIKVIKWAALPGDEDE